MKRKQVSVLTFNLYEKMKSIEKETLAQYPLDKGDFAQLYSPRVCRKSALRLLNGYIHRAKGLLPLLEDMGYSRSARRLTVRQLEAILSYIGEPYVD